ncbi:MULTISPECIES: hypothetical protein [Oscillatoriales]|nr:hypothetical protein [Limnospira sp. Paracas R14]
MNFNIQNSRKLEDILFDSNTMENIEQYPINIIHNIALADTLS